MTRENDDPKIKRAAVVAEKESSLIRRSQQGDRHAFETLVSTHYRNVYGLALVLSKDREQAADIAQEAVLKSFRKIRAYRHQAPFVSWLLQITRNTFIDQARKSTQLQNKHQKLKFQQINAPSANPEKLLSQKRTIEAVWTAIDRVTQPYRTVLHLFDVQGFSYMEISLICQVPVGTVKSRLRRGRDELRQILLAEGLLNDIEHSVSQE
jgi:RNA polymerase sigma-70 factor (ECF subfamily)